MLGPEPTLIIQAVVAMLVAANTILTTTSALPLPPWVSTVISIVLVGLGALVNRSQVTPVQKANTTVLAQQPESGSLTPIQEPSADLEQGPDPVPENLDADQWLANRQPGTGS